MGFRKYLTHHVPETIEFALKWNNAKTKWIEYIYTTWLKHIAELSEKEKITANLLGTNGNGFDFASTIVWTNLTDEEKEFWKTCDTWILWFQKNFIIFLEKYKEYKEKGLSELEMLVHFELLMKDNVDESLWESLSEYLLKCIKTSKQL